jgi:hypothetical protein
MKRALVRRYTTARATPWPGAGARCQCHTRRARSACLSASEKRRSPRGGSLLSSSVLGAPSGGGSRADERRGSRHAGVRLELPVASGTGNGSRG